MAIIGKFKKVNDGLEGVISTLTLKSRLDLVPIGETSNDIKNPAYRIMFGQLEVGAAWRKFSRLDKREYFQCRIDDPALSAPIYASLVAVGEESRDYLLLWTRQAKG